MSPIKVVHFAPGGERQAGDTVINPGETETIQVGAETATIACNDNQGKIAFDPKRVWIDLLETTRPFPGQNEGVIKTHPGENYLVRPSGSSLRPEDKKNNVVVYAEVYHT